ncbi:UNVERIFIED_CONTAM: hypothetical protein K2H54_057595, partial [Gekko kuhli]
MLHTARRVPPSPTSSGGAAGETRRHGGAAGNSGLPSQPSPGGLRRPRRVSCRYQTSRS